MADVFDAVRDFWIDQQLKSNAGVSESELADFERRYTVQLPASVRDYFARLNGVNGGCDGAWDDQMVAAWPLKDVRPLSEECPDMQLPDADRYFAFADWSIWAHAYAVLLSKDPESPTPVFIVAPPTYCLRVADNFLEFWEGYLRRDPSVLFGVGPEDSPAV